jgi:hypothetical protein
MGARRFQLPKDGAEPDGLRQLTPEDADDVEGHIIRRSPSTGGEATPDADEQPDGEGDRD